MHAVWAHLLDPDYRTGIPLYEVWLLCSACCVAVVDAGPGAAARKC